MADQADPLSALSGIPAPPRSGENWNAFVDILQQRHTGGAGWPTEMEYARRWYEPHLERIHEEPPCGRLTCCNSNRSRQAIHPASGF
jgi:ATP-dependent DNA helicase UvrD/PcrA